MHCIGYMNALFTPGRVKIYAKITNSPCIGPLYFFLFLECKIILLIIFIKDVGNTTSQTSILRLNFKKIVIIREGETFGITSTSCYSRF